MDFSAILQDAGFDDLLDQHDKSVLATDATRRPVRQPIKVSPLAPRGFFDDSSNRARFSARPDGHNSSSRPRIFHWARNMLSGRSDSGTELRSVDVPCAKGKRRNACAREKRRPIPKNATASASRPNTTQQSNGAVQSSSQPHTAISMSSATPPPPAAATPEATATDTNPHAMIKHAGR